MIDPLVEKWIHVNGGTDELTEFQLSKPEAPWYLPTKKFMKIFLEDLGCNNVHLEITGTNHFSPKLKDAFGEPLILLDYSFSPDISGVFEKNGEKIIVVEVKPDEMKMRDVYQTIEYVELVNAEIGILITPKKIPVKFKKYFNENPELLTMCGRRIFIGTISIEEEKFIPEEWYPYPPDL